MTTLQAMAERELVMQKFEEATKKTILSPPLLEKMAKAGCEESIRQYFKENPCRELLSDLLKKHAWDKQSEAVREAWYRVVEAILRAGESDA